MDVIFLGKIVYVYLMAGLASVLEIVIKSRRREERDFKILRAKEKNNFGGLLRKLSFVRCRFSQNVFIHHLFMCATKEMIGN